MTEQELVRRARTGNRAALGEVYDLRGDPVASPVLLFDDTQHLKGECVSTVA